ncbi:hypothetical protein SAZ11_44385 [Streptomyces sp. FXJ1.4098]|nr:hypothetical protein [Streptomyces sp. FXJ1.4098]
MAGRAVVTRRRPLRHRCRDTPRVGVEPGRHGDQPPVDPGPEPRPLPPAWWRGGRAAYGRQRRKAEAYGGRLLRQQGPAGQHIRGQRIGPQNAHGAHRDRRARCRRRAASLAAYVAASVAGYGRLAMRRLRIRRPEMRRHDSRAPDAPQGIEGTARQELGRCADSSA